MCPFAIHTNLIRHISSTRIHLNNSLSKRSIKFPFSQSSNPSINVSFKSLFHSSTKQLVMPHYGRLCREDIDWWRCCVRSNPHSDPAIMDVSHANGVGFLTKVKLNAAGVYTIAQLASVPRSFCDILYAQGLSAIHIAWVHARVWVKEWEDMEKEKIQAVSESRTTTGPGTPSPTPSRAARQERIRSIEDRIRSKLVSASQRGKDVRLSSQTLDHRATFQQYRALQLSQIDAQKYAGHAPSPTSSSSLPQPRPGATNQPMPGDESE